MSKQFVLLSLLAVVVVACASSTPAATTAPISAPPTAGTEPTSAPPTAPTATAGAPAAQLEKVSLACGAPVPGVLVFLPCDVANALGLFKQEGLDMTMGGMTAVNMTMSGMTPVNADSALSGGPVDFAVIGIDEPITWQGKGNEARMVMELTRFYDIALLVRSDMKDKIKTVADLHGQTIPHPGALGVMPYIIAKAGLEPQDVQFVSAGGGQIASAMQAGKSVAAIELEPFATRLIQSGTAYALVDLATEADSTKWLGGEYPNCGLVATTDTIQKRPQTVQKLTNALVKALRYMATHSAADIAAILPDSVTGKDRALYIAALQHILPSFSKDGVVNEAGVKNAIAINEALGVIKPDQQISVGALYDNEFVNNVK